MKTVFICYKRPKFSTGITRPVFSTDPQNYALIEQMELVKETPKGWKLSRNGKPPRLFLACDYDVYDTLPEALAVVKEKLRTSREVTRRWLGQLDMAIGICETLEAGE